MYQIPELLKYKHLFHAFSQKSEGNMANSVNGVIHNFGKVINNRKQFLRKVGVDINKSICLWVTHGDKIIKADTRSAGISMINYHKAVRVDGLITDKKRLYLFLLVADCLPIIIYDPIKEVVALLHAGWKGVDLKIAKKAVHILKKNCGSKPEDLIIGIGPCVYKKSFVKENPSQTDNQEWKGYIELVKNDQYGIDLVGFAKEQLIESGVMKKNIFESGIDTAKDNNFFSHIRDKNLPIAEQGRFACVVGLK